MCIYFTYIYVYVFYISTGDSDGQLGLRALPVGIPGWGPCQGARGAMWREWTVWGQSASRKQELGGRAWLPCNWVQVEGCQQSSGRTEDLAPEFLRDGAPSPSAQQALRCPGVSTPQSPSWSLYPGTRGAPDPRVSQGNSKTGQFPHGNPISCLARAFLGDSKSMAETPTLSQQPLLPPG